MIGVGNKKQPCCAIIACDNGYGHVRRCLIIAESLVSCGWNVELYAPHNAVKKITALKTIDRNLKIIDFHAGITIDSLKSGRASYWYNKLPSLKEYDLVYSDNLPEVLVHRADAIIGGSFLWHTAIEGIDAGMIKHANELLTKIKPKMIASSLFASSNLADLTELYPVGLYTSMTMNSSNSSRGNSLLISCGMSGEFENELRSLITTVACKSQTPFDQVFVEPRLLPHNRPSWMKAATYDQAMYRGLKAAICRPGVGTVTDSLWGWARIFSCFESENREMLYNAEAINRSGLGSWSATPIEAFDLACSYCSDHAQYKNHIKALDRISFKGAEETVALFNSFSACL
jgi:hypothetical protein